MKLNLSYPKRFVCVQSSSYPNDWNHNTDEIDYNALAQHIANSVPRSPLERMEDLLTERTYVR
jgi:hypothetical protein